MSPLEETVIVTFPRNGLVHKLIARWVAMRVAVLMEVLTDESAEQYMQAESELGVIGRYLESLQCDTLIADAVNYRNNHPTLPF